VPLLELILTLSSWVCATAAKVRSRRLRLVSTESAVCQTSARDFSGAICCNQPGEWRTPHGKRNELTQASCVHLPFALSCLRTADLSATLAEAKEQIENARTQLLPLLTLAEDAAAEIENC
jgi:hypothetical protein